MLKKSLVFFTIATLLLAALTIIPQHAKAATVVSRVVVSPEGKGYLEVDGKPYLDLHVQNGGVLLPSKLPLSFFENYYEKTAQANIKTASVIFRWSNIEPGNQGEYDWTIIDRYVDWANKYGLRLDLAWFGTNGSGGAYLNGLNEDTTVPAYLQDKDRYWGAGDGGNYAPWLPDGGPHDADARFVFQAERNAVSALFNHLANYDTNHRVIFFQLDNEVNDTPTWNGQRGIWLDLLNQLGGVIKNSDYVVATRINLGGGSVNDADITPLSNVDAVGYDPYTLQPDDIRNIISSTTSKYRYIAENSGGYGNTSTLALTALVNGGFYDIWQIVDNATYPQGIYADSAEGAANDYRNWTLGNSYPLKYGLDSTQRLYGVLNKIPTIVATAPTSKIAGYNIDTFLPEGNYGQAKVVNGKDLSFSTDSGAVGLIVNKDNYYYALSDARDGTANYFSTAQEPASASVGYIDDNGNWVNEANVPVTDNGNGTWGIFYYPGSVLRIELP
ncbi:hypothetical protein KDA_06610 [Dictyobacter alpinus]|uniref:Glycoside hydrolase family 42 N-terminal domain-containing protein n=1 Tax=Dictyobacter alpinus TaxID=2014873 RepID=A0A402B1J7_9CHLR|nr:DUF4978 domain-containing protein [Dictyobacter alpinus]GCE25177.1 hypothetical protein KDA_06610 [Dictyobacter alpinus]